MAWFELHQELWSHPKTKRLARLLNITRPQAVGHVVGLWIWALDYAQDGNLSTYEASDIADACDWTGDPAALVDALLDCGRKEGPGFLVRGDHGLEINDWSEYGGKTVTRRTQTANRQRTYRERNADVTRYSSVTNDATVQYSTRQDKTEQDRTKEPERAAADLPDETVDAFKDQYENILGMMPTTVFPDAREYMAKLHARAADDWWLMALRETVDYANRPGWPYMKSVLERWLAAGAANPTAGKGKQTNGKSSLGLRRDPNDYPTHKPDAAEIAELQRALAEAEANAARPAHLS